MVPGLCCLTVYLHLPGLPCFVDNYKTDTGSQLLHDAIFMEEQIKVWLHPSEASKCS